MMKRILLSFLVFVLVLSTEAGAVDECADYVKSGDRWLSEGNYYYAADSYETAAECYEGSGDGGLAMEYYIHAAENYVEDINWELSIYELNERNYGVVAMGYTMAAKCYGRASDIESAEEYYAKATPLFVRVAEGELVKKNYKEVADSYYLAACCYLLANNYTESMRYAKESLDYYKRIGGKEDMKYYLLKTVTTKDVGYLEKAEESAKVKKQKEWVNTIREKLSELEIINQTTSTTTLKQSKTPDESVKYPKQPFFDLSSIIAVVIITIIIGAILMRRK